MFTLYPCLLYTSQQQFPSATRTVEAGRGRIRLREIWTENIWVVWLKVQLWNSPETPWNWPQCPWGSETHWAYQMGIGVALCLLRPVNKEWAKKGVSVYVLLAQGRIKSAQIQTFGDNHAMINCKILLKDKKYNIWFGSLLRTSSDVPFTSMFWHFLFSL
mgnify:CR=1 FL=1